MISAYFKKHNNMIRKLCWKYSKTSGEPFEELYSYACWVYVEKFYRYDADKHTATRATFMYTVIRNGLVNYLLKENQRRNAVQIIEDYARVPHPEVTQNESYLDFYNKLTARGKTVIDYLFDSSGFSPRSTRQDILEVVVNKMKSDGLCMCDIWPAIRDIKRKYKLVYGTD